MSKSVQEILNLIASGPVANVRECPQGVVATLVNAVHTDPTAGTYVQSLGRLTMDIFREFTPMLYVKPSSTGTATLYCRFRHSVDGGATWNPLTTLAGGVIELSVASADTTNGGGASFLPIQVSEGLIEAYYYVSSASGGVHGDVTIRAAARA